MMKAKEKKIIPGCEETEIKGNEVGCLLIHGFRSCPFEMVEYGQYLVYLVMFYMLVVL